MKNTLSLLDFLADLKFHSAIPGYYCGHGYSVFVSSICEVRSNTDYTVLKIGSDYEVLEFLKGLIDVR